MGTSALKLVTGVLDGKSIRNNIEQGSHGFTAGNVVRFDPSVLSGNGGFTLAFATSPKEAESSGIIERVSDANNFTVVYQGEIDISNFPDMGNTADECYFLSSVTAGHLNSVPPTMGGHVIKPMLTRRGKIGTTPKGLVMNYLGTIIGGEATVSLNGLMPVGAIQAYAGHTSGIPEQWGLCDGSTLDALRHGDYYTAVSWRYGSWQKIKVPSLDDNSSLIGSTIKQTLDDGTQANATIISWNNDSKEMIIDNETHDSDTGKIITETSLRNALFVNSELIGIDGADPTYSVSEVSIHSVKKPDLRSRVPMGEGNSAGVDDYFERGQFGGARTVALGIENIPSHNHAFEFDSVQNLEINIPTHRHTIPSHSHTISGAGAHGHRIDLAGEHRPGAGEQMHPKAVNDTLFGGNGPYCSGSNNNSIVGKHPVASTTWPSAHCGTVTDFSNQPGCGTRFITRGESSEGSHSHTISASNATNTGYDGNWDNQYDLSEYLTGTAAAQGGDAPHNNLQPYLVTHYIIRISSEARASLIDGIDLSISMEGLSNVNDGDPAHDEMVRYNSDTTEYEKFAPVIQGMSSKDNEDVVIHTSQDTDGLTQEAMRIGTDGRVWFGATVGNTASWDAGIAHIQPVLNIKTQGENDNAYIFIQGGSPSQSGMTGSRFGHYNNRTHIWNSTPYSNSGRSFHFYFNASNDIGGFVAATLYPYGFGVGNIFPGASLDSGGDIRASGDIYTYGGGTHGLFANLLGVSAAVGGYNLPVTAGGSGEVLMVCATGGGIGYTLEFRPQESATSLWSGHAATGASFGGTVGIGTGGNGSGTSAGHFGALLEVGGGAWIHGAVTADSLYVGGATSNYSNALISGLTSGQAIGSLRSTSNHAFHTIDCEDGYDASIKFHEDGIEKASIRWRGYNDQVQMAAMGNTFMHVNSSGQVALGTGSAINTQYNVNIGSTFGGLRVDSEFNLFSNGTGSSSGHASIIQAYKTNQSFIQFGNTAGDGTAGVQPFGATCGFFLGITSDNHAQVKHIGNHGGTIDFVVGNTSGNTAAMIIHSNGVVQIGVTAGGAELPVSGGGGLAVVDHTGSTGSSGDVLVNCDNTGLSRWAPTGIVGACHFTLTVDGDADASSLGDEFKNGGISDIALSSGTITITHTCGTANFVPMITANPAAEADNDMYFVAGPTKTSTTLTFKPKRGSSNDPISYFFSVVLIRL